MQEKPRIRQSIAGLIKNNLMRQFEMQATGALIAKLNEQADKLEQAKSEVRKCELAIQKEVDEADPYNRL